MKRTSLLALTLVILVAAWFWQRTRAPTRPLPEPTARADAHTSPNAARSATTSQKGRQPSASKRSGGAKRQRHGAPTTSVGPDNSGGPLAALRSKPLRYTRHARCRMGCRFIDEDEVEEILQRGRLDPSRTRDNGQCTSYALEGRTRDEQHVRIVFADCKRETRVVTAIDLGENHPCNCR